MAFVVIGVLLVVLRLGGWVQFHKDDVWAWAIVLSPFGLAALWWWWADITGLTQRKAMASLDAKKAARRAQQMEALGQLRPGDKRRR
ncbi:TIGR04438 family Trp-rich protein [Pelomonas cellulosilytica]|uniref:TIGR04438 family Trp-rich protein n=1 Tax=Pelomonas cellulosilytica TaxID=2906762 RepID=A0ABS8XRG2_9BURK|nr:TIGR04438 family Trp-rich protein [Pelomonas sp. P8]MCE4555311.1 TIGR04438 family Trp-rich protein [Pelomonas sp. P8]